MKLQLALDLFDLETALAVTKEARDYVDIIEIGTPFLMQYDAKIMDAGRLEVTAALEAGADYATVLAVTDLLTMQECVDAANRLGKRVVADMICVSDLPARARELEAIGVHGLAVHTGVDQQKAGRTPLGDLRVLKAHARRAEISVAGGIRLQTVPAYAALSPDVLIVGGAIGTAPDPAKAAREIWEAMRACEAR